MKNKTLPIATLALLLLLAGCQGVTKYLRLPLDSGASREYRVAFDKWTKSVSIHSGFTTNAVIYATYNSKEFADVLVAEQSRMYGLPVANLSQNDREGVAEFFVYIVTPSAKTNESRKPNWRIYILDNEREITPKTVKWIHPLTTEMKELYPYTQNGFGYFYSIIFPVTEGKEPKKSQKLIFGGPLGRGEIIWKM
ncbi:MAG: hypothetical protein K9K75_06425 [Deltaproteobacteria bacterium]|nr:hypothetical protein [Deltaproteobacteria bacterium]